MTLNYKIVLVGDGGVGKSNFMKRHLTGDFEMKYTPTVGVDIFSLTFQTNYGPILFEVLDCAGQEKIGGLRDQYYGQSQGAICMFDLNSIISSRNVGNWINDIRITAPNTPVVICGNKCDIPNRKVIERIDAQDLCNVKYCELSARNKQNLNKPFLELAKQLTGHEDLEFYNE